MTAGRSTDVPSVSQFNDLQSKPATYSHESVVTTAQASLGSTDRAFVSQPIEGLNWRDAIGRQGFLNFWIKTSTPGTYWIVLAGTKDLGAGATRKYIISYTVNAANTWEYKTISLGQIDPNFANFNMDTSHGIYCQFTFAAGTGLQNSSTVGSWFTSSANIQAGSGITNILGTLNNYVRLTNIYFSTGNSTSTPNGFATRGSNYAEELTLCQRYYEKSYPVNDTPGNINISTIVGSIANTSAGNNVIATCAYKTQKRATAGITYYEPATGAVGSWHDNGGASIPMTNYDNSPNGFIAASAGGVVNGRIVYGHWTADAEL